MLTKRSIGVCTDQLVGMGTPYSLTRIPVGLLRTNPVHWLRNPTSDDSMRSERREVEVALAPM